MALPEHSSAIHPGLERVPGIQNWIERLPGPMRAAWKKSWIYRAAKHLVADAGYTVGRAIATAINAAEKGCATGDLNFPGIQSVNAKSRAEMCAARTLWGAMKAASGSKGMPGKLQEQLSEDDFEPERFLLAPNIGRIALKELEDAEIPTDEEVFAQWGEEFSEINLEECSPEAQSAIIAAFTDEEDGETHENPKKESEKPQELPGTLLERITGLFQELQAATVDAVGRVWRGSDHPRGAGGTFSPKAGGEEPTNRAETIKNLIGQMDLGDLSKWRGALLQAALQAAQTGEMDTAAFSSMPDALQQQAVEVVASVLEQAGLKKKEASQNMSEEPLYQLPIQLSEPTQREGLWRKALVPVGKKILKKGKPLDFSRQTLQRMVDNFKAKAYDQVPLLNGHTDSVDAYLGELVDLELDNQWLWGVFKPSLKGSQILKENPKLPTSVGYWEDYTRPSDGKNFGPTLQHVAALFRPHVPGLGTWEPIQLSSEAVVVDLTEAEFASSEAAPTREERDPVSDAVKTDDRASLAQPKNSIETREEVEVKTKMNPETETKPEATTPKETEEETNMVSLEEFNALRDQLENKLEEERQERIKETTRLRRQGIRKMLNEDYVDKGVPSAKANAAFTLLSAEEGLVTLSEDGDASVSEDARAKAVAELLEGYKGTLKFGEEGTSEEGEEPDTETRIDKRARILMSEKDIAYPAALDLALLEEEVR